MSRLFVARSVHTLDPGTPGGTGVLVDRGRVVAVADAEDLRASAAEVVDLGDAVLTPGLVDGHSHPVKGLSLTAGTDLTEMLDLESVRGALAEARERLAPGEWLRGWGLNPVVFGRSAPSAAALGATLDGIAAYVILYDGHSAIASAEAAARREAYRAANPRVGAAIGWLTVGLALVAGSLVSILWPQFTDAGRYTTAAGLAAATLVVGVTVIVAGLARRRSGFLIFLGILLAVLTGAALFLAGDGLAGVRLTTEGLPVLLPQ